MICQMLKPLDTRWLVNGCARPRCVAQGAHQRVPEDSRHLADPTAKRFAIAIDCSARLHWEIATADSGHVSPHFQTFVTALRQPTSLSEDGNGSTCADWLAHLSGSKQSSESGGIGADARQRCDRPEAGLREGRLSGWRYMIAPTCRAKDRTLHPIDLRLRQ